MRSDYDGAAASRPRELRAPVRAAGPAAGSISTASTPVNFVVPQRATEEIAGPRREIVEALAPLSQPPLVSAPDRGGVGVPRRKPLSHGRSPSARTRPAPTRTGRYFFAPPSPPDGNACAPRDSPLPFGRCKTRPGLQSPTGFADTTHGVAGAARSRARPGFWRPARRRIERVRRACQFSGPGAPEVEPDPAQIDIEPSSVAVNARLSAPLPSIRVDRRSAYAQLLSPARSCRD